MTPLPPAPPEAFNISAHLLAVNAGRSITSSAGSEQAFLKVKRT